ncbi:MAG: toxin-antitoxin system HicB family antitoxin [Desulfobacula sp.]|nr:toxin-antitoxin system HicB family antitoxin [Desulfobacula sp.]
MCFLQLKIFWNICKEEGINPHKEYSEKFNLRVSLELHTVIATKAAGHKGLLPLFPPLRSANPERNRSDLSSPYGKISSVFLLFLTKNKPYFICLG